MAQREPKQSLLDYLWANFGNYSVSFLKDGDKQIPTVELIDNLLTSIKDNALHSLSVIGYKLIGMSINGLKLCEINISELINNNLSIVGFGKRYIKEGETGIQFPIGTPVYYIKLADGTEFVAEANEGGVVYTGAETNTIVVNITDNLISAKLKLDNENSVINLKESSKGLRADLKIDESSLIKFLKGDSGLKAEVDTYTKNEIDEKLADKGMEWNTLI